MVFVSISRWQDTFLIKEHHGTPRHHSLTLSTTSLFLSRLSSFSIRASSSPSPPPSSLDSLQILQYPLKPLKLFNHLHKVPSFDFPLRDPQPKSTQFFKILLKVPSFDPPLQDPQLKFPQFFYLIPKNPSFVTIIASSSTLFFLGCCQHSLRKATTSLSSSVVSIEEIVSEKTTLKNFRDITFNFVLHLKLK